jgi:glycolate oxidase
MKTFRRSRRTHKAGPKTRADAAIDLLMPIVGRDAIICDPVELATYECGGLTHFRVQPTLAVLAGSSHDVEAVVGACARLELPFVARGAGTGLSGGSVDVDKVRKLGAWAAVLESVSSHRRGCLRYCV